GVGLAAGVPAAALGLWLRRQRRWLEVTLTGFVLSRQGRRQVYTDGQVVGIARQVAPGPHGNLKRRLVLEVGADEPERIDCRYDVPNGRPDPLEGFVSRLVDAVAAAAERGLKGGAAFRGAGWSL